MAKRGNVNESLYETPIPMRVTRSDQAVPHPPQVGLHEDGKKEQTSQITHGKNLAIASIVVLILAIVLLITSVILIYLGQHNNGEVPSNEGVLANQVHGLKEDIASNRSQAILKKVTDLGGNIARISSAEEDLSNRVHKLKESIDEIGASIENVQAFNQSMLYEFEKIAEDIVSNRSQDILKKVTEIDRNIANLTTEMEYIMTDISWIRASNGMHYRIFHDKVNFLTARSRCRGMQAGLVTVGLRDPAVYGKLKQYILSKGSDVWIGMSDRTSEGAWVYDDGIAVDMTNADWGKNEPNNQDGNEDCGEFSMILKQLNDEKCEFPQSYLCEK